MNRTDRLYALVEELRAVAPRPLSARRLAERFEVSARTIERDLGALQESGVPIYAEPGRRGGYTLDKSRTLPPVNVTPAEAVAIAVALGRLGGGPFADGARSALHKLLAVMPTADVARAEDLARRVHLISRAEAPATSPVPRVIADALAAGRLLRIGYIDRGGAPSTRAVEPVGYAGVPARPHRVGGSHRRGGRAAADPPGRPGHPAGTGDPGHNRVAGNTDRTVSRRWPSLIPSPANRAGHTGGDRRWPR
jgi:predicted DNA-binding transcriptional regulator YafY